MSIRLGIVRDFRAEQWPSMDLCADQLLAHLPATGTVATVELEPAFVRRVQRLPILGRRKAAFNADRLVNRHLVLPRFLRRHRNACDFFHIVDHSYAHAALAMPAGRVGVYCHDLDAFRAILEPDREPRPWWFRRLARRTLRGLQSAAVVFHSTATVRAELLRHGLIDTARLVHAPYGVASEFAPHADGFIELPAPGIPDGPFLLHVGSHIPRKRIDVLLDVFAAVHKHVPNVRLVQVGPPWPAQYLDRIERLGLHSAIAKFTDLGREQLAELYRRAALVLVPSEAEGFGLPVIEALACGSAVIASDIPVLREVGEQAATYCPMGDVASWVKTITALLVNPSALPPLDIRLARAARFTWREHARIIGETYLHLARRAN